MPHADAAGPELALPEASLGDHRVAVDTMAGVAAPGEGNANESAVGADPLGVVRPSADLADLVQAKVSPVRAGTASSTPAYSVSAPSRRMANRCWSSSREE